MTKEPAIPKDAIALADELRSALHHVFRRIRQEGDSDPHGLTLQHKLLLSTISQTPGIGVAELARMEKLRGPTMSGHIKALENAGLVRRDAPNPEDRRRVGLLLTPQGAAVLEDIRSRRLDWLARKLAQLQPEGAQALRDAIKYLNEIGE
ncbi:MULTISPECIES: MarR family winged helix-turn-helix transcriptional regulator [unclassified Duganella]|uniref:MarR family winged helix-turn-helix transcriptional regulator n=1 Tax=unclassified Duganella TaxID=2636909 RepID=UPI000E34F2D9|nr:MULTISPECIES: MarR family transcriptional regulator [unclassified Duganella]RFP13543.1 MarR family transcriptional regulator [Duganella sp. BJB475]RFP36252.1 MarR family transcriptional regulator [Duganella sp. BJB476]